MRSSRTASVIAGFALFVAACGGADAEPANPTDVVPSTQSQSDDSTPSNPDPTTTATTASAAPSNETTAPTAAERPAPDPNREIAPDFSLALGNGSTFVLSEETRPVFMVFWAEW